MSYPNPMTLHLLPPGKLDWTDPLSILIPFVSILGWGLLNMGEGEQWKIYHGPVLQNVKCWQTELSSRFVLKLQTAYQMNSYMKKVKTTIDLIFCCFWLIIFFEVFQKNKKMRLSFNFQKNNNTTLGRIRLT